MADEHTLSGLIRKRAEIAGQLEHAHTTVRQLLIDLDALDQTIRLFAPDIDLEDIRPKALPPRHAAFKGEVLPIVLAMLRDKGPMATVDIVESIMEGRGLNTADKRLFLLIRKRVGSCLRHLRKTHRVRSRQAPGKTATWEIRGSTEGA